MNSFNVIKGVFFTLILLSLLPLQAIMIINALPEPSGTLLIEPRKNQAIPQGLSFFPLGIHGVRNSTEIWISWKQRFNIVSFGYAESNDFVELDIEDMLFTCDVLGMKVLFDISYYVQNHEMDVLQDLILRLVKHPSIYAWYLMDVLSSDNNTLFDELMIQTAVNTIQLIDDHPTLIQISLESQNIDEWLNSFEFVPNYIDIISLTSFSEMPLINHTRISTLVDHLIRFNAGRAKIWTALSAKSSNLDLNAIKSSIPTEPEYMMDSMLVLQRGVEGLHWFSYGFKNNSKYGVFSFPDSWVALSRVIRRISQVTPILVGRENEMVVLPLTGTVDASYAKRGNQIVMFLTNNDYHWNGIETEWGHNNITITLDISNIESLSIIEPSGQIPLDYMFVGSTLSFNISINGGIILLLESTGLISLIEYQNHPFIFFTIFALLIILYHIKSHKKQSP